MAPPAEWLRSVFAFAWRAGRRQQAALCLLAALTVPLGAVPLELQRRIVNDAIGGPDLTLLLWLGGAYLGVLLLEGGLKYVLNVSRGRLGERTVRRLRAALFGASRSGADVSVAAAEAEHIGGFVGESFSEPVMQAGLLLGILGYMLAVEPLIVAVPLVFFLPQLVFVPRLQAAINRLSAQHIALVREVGDRLVESGATDGRAPAEVDDDRLRRIYRLRLAIYRRKFLLKVLVNLLVGLGPLAVLVVGGVLAIRGDTTVGVIVAFVSGFDRLAGPARELIDYYRVASEAGIRYRLLAERLAVPAGPLAAARLSVVFRIRWADLR